MRSPAGAQTKETVQYGFNEDVKYFLQTEMDGVKLTRESRHPDSIFAIPHLTLSSFKHDVFLGFCSNTMEKSPVALYDWKITIKKYLKHRRNIRDRSVMSLLAGWNEWMEEHVVKHRHLFLSV